MAAPDPQVPGLPEEVAAIRREISGFLDRRDTTNRKIGNSTFGVYIFYDYDGEPIYVGQTKESLRSRISRHLTNQRTDAVAMNVLDPFEVAEIEVWPLDDLISDIPVADRAAFLDRAEFTVFQKALAESRLGAILNEKEVPPLTVIALPTSFRGRIIPESIYPRRKHPDVRAARRAATIAALARVISERDVSDGLRRTLLTQARRLELLASQRLTELGIPASRDIPTLPPPDPS
jgi:hypothetical protein